MSTAIADHTRDGHERAADRVGSPWVGAIAFEWTKLVSVRSTWWIVAVSVLATLFGSGLLGASALASGRNGLDSAAPAPYFVVQTMIAVEFIVVLLGTFAITGEYSTGSVMTTLQSVPRRSRLLLAKALVQFGTGCALGLMFVVLGTPVAAVFSAEFGAFESSDLVRAALGTGIGLGLLNVFVLGLGTVLRSAAMTIITTLALLQLVPSLLPLFGVTLMSELARFLPNQAIAVLSVDAPGPYGWPIALLVLGCWAAAGLLCGGLLLRTRDA